MHELPLIAFTLLLQGSVGLTLWLTFIHRQAVAEGSPRQVMLPSLMFAFLAAALGLIISTLHLGYPLNALHALRHFSGYWLSREIIFASLYLVALGLSTLLVLVRKSGWQVLLILAAVIGVVDVFCMAQIYMHTTVSTWQHFNTLVMFGGSVGILGAVFIAALRVSGLLTPLANMWRWVTLIVALLVLARLLVQPLWLSDIASLGAQAVTLPHIPLAMLETLQTFMTISWVVCVVGMLCFIFGYCKKANSAIVAGSVLLVVAEIMLRFVFFRIG
ncbi:TPA: dimethyl sulfoxide reductase anchor subunit [Citrobacter freundii]|nr:dimethyl sulfoxide reductase anchor subunit [Citrobacter freundii]